MSWIDVLGMVAATCTTSAFLPQVIKVWRTRSAKDFSTVTLIALNIGIFLWLVYGILIQALPVIVANALTLALTMTIFLLKQKYG